MVWLELASSHITIKVTIRKLKLASFHGPDRRATEGSVLVGDVTRALIGFMQFSAQPAVFAVVAGGVKRGPFHVDVFAGGDI